MLVGRDALLAAGITAIRRASSGRGALILLAGEAGIGKTSLAHALLDEARTQGAVVRIGACWETEALPAFTPWLDALRRPGGDAGALAADQLEGDEVTTDAATAQRARRRRFADVVDALHDAGRVAPQVVLLEDLHWADEPSLELLAAVAAHLPTMPVLVVGTYRPDELEPGGPLATLGGRADRYDLTGLAPAAVAELLTALLADAPSVDEARQVHERSGGNPLFVTQLARLIDAGSTAAPAGVREVLERRLARVSTDVADVLGAAAVLGHEFDRRALAVLVGADPARALDVARSAGLVEPTDDPDRWRFVHALVQTTHYDGLQAAKREAWHAAAVDALRNRPGTTAATLAHHAMRAGGPPEDPVAAVLLLEAGRDALARLAWDDAGAAFERARHRAPAGPAGHPLRAEAWLGTGDARLRADRSDARSAFDEAAALARSIGDPGLLARSALGFAVGMGTFEVQPVDHHQIDLLEEAELVLAVEAPDHPLRPFVLARLSVALSFIESDERRTELADRAVGLARRSGDPITIGHALAAWCDARSGPHDVIERRNAAAEMVTLAARAGDARLELLGRRFRVVALLEEGLMNDVDHEIASYERTAAMVGDPFYGWFGPLWRSTRAHARGELTAAQALSAEAMRIGLAGGSSNAELLGLVQRGTQQADGDDRVESTVVMAEIATLMPEIINPYGSLTTAFALARIGDRAGAVAQSRVLTPEVLDGLPRDSEWLPGLAQLGVVAAVSERRDLAEMAVRELTPIAEVHAVEGIGAYQHGSAHRFLALAHAVLGDADAVRRHVAAARIAVDGNGALLEAGTALDAAWALDLVGDHAGAAERGSVAEAAFVALGLPLQAGDARAYVATEERGTASAPSPTSGTEPSLERQGDLWAWTWQGSVAHVRHAKGMADLALLLERPGREVHVRELEGVADAAGRPASHQAALDETAVAQYRQRLQDLEDDLDEADRHGDSGRAATLAAERDALVDELTKAFGVGGRSRRAGSDPDERLRKAVSARVKASIDRVEEQLPGLGRHLRNSVRTGFWCAYEPEISTVWDVRR